MTHFKWSKNTNSNNFTFAHYKNGHSDNFFFFNTKHFSGPSFPTVVSSLSGPKFLQPEAPPRC